MILVETKMNCANNVFVSYRLFILYLSCLYFTFEFWSLFRDVAFNVNGNLLFSNSKQKLRSLLLKLREQEFDRNSIYGIIYLAFQS